MSVLDFKEREDFQPLCAYSPVHDGVTFGETPTDLLAASMAADPVSHLDTCSIASISPWFKCVNEKVYLGQQSNK